MEDNYIIYNDGSLVAQKMEEFMSEKGLAYSVIYKEHGMGASIFTENFGTFKEKDFSNFRSLVDLISN